LEIDRVVFAAGAAGFWALYCDRSIILKMGITFFIPVIAIGVILQSLPDRNWSRNKERD